MRLAIAGKGGSGKTSIAGTMSRLLARRGHDVLAIDADANPNLALTLGVPPERLGDLPVLPPDLLTWGPDAVLTESLDQIKAAYSVDGADGVRLLVMALAQSTGCNMHATVRRIVDAVPRGGRDVCLLDTDASPELFLRGVPAFADVVLVVVEPYFKSLDAGRRMAALARDLGLPRVALLANKIRGDDDLGAVQAFAARSELELGGVVPFDAGFPDAERAGLAPLDFASGDLPAVAAIDAIGCDWVRRCAHGAGS